MIRCQLLCPRFASVSCDSDSSDSTAQGHMKKERSAPQKIPKMFYNVPFLFKMPPKKGGSSKKYSKFQGKILPILYSYHTEKPVLQFLWHPLVPQLAPTFLRSSNPGTCPYLLPWHLGSIFGSTPVGGIGDWGGGRSLIRSRKEEVWRLPIGEMSLDEFVVLLWFSLSWLV